MTLFIWNVALVVCIFVTTEIGGLDLELPAALGLINISDIIHSFDYYKSSSFSLLINGKSSDLQKLLKHVNATTTSSSNILLSFGVFPIDFVLYSKDLLVVFCYIFSY